MAAIAQQELGSGLKRAELPDLLILPGNEAPQSSSPPGGDQSAPSDSPVPSARLQVAQSPAHLLAEAHQKSREAKTIAEYGQILDRCRQALSAEPANEVRRYAEKLSSWALNRRGELLAQQGEEEAAFDDFEEAVRLDATRWRAIHNRGVSYAMLGKHELAIADFTRTIELSPSYANAYFNRGELLYEQGKFQAAIDDYTRAIGQSPEDAVAYNSRGHAHFRLTQYREAVRDYTTALRLDPKFAAAYVNRGDLYTELGYFDRALTDFQAAMQTGVEFARAYQSLGWLLATCPDERLRDPAQALRMLAKSQELAGRPVPAVLDAMAAAHAAAGDFNQAKKLVNQAIHAAPPHLANQYRARLDLYLQNQPYIDAPRKVQTAARPAGEATSR
jgi:tetratricopeptide (TPR) repeat protein